MRDWGFWDWLGYAALGVAAMIAAANASLSSAPKLLAALPDFFSGEIIQYLPLAFFVLATLILVARNFGWLPGKNVVHEKPDPTLPQKLPAPFGMKFPDGKPFIWEKSGLYVGEMAVDLKNLESNLFLELGIRIFNATGAAIDIFDIEGAAHYCETTKAAPGDQVVLPRPVLRERCEAISNLREHMVVIQQRMLRADAERFLQRLESGERNFFAFDSLDVMMRPFETGFAPVRLPLPGMISFHKEEGIRVWPVIFVSGNAKAGRATVGSAPPSTAP